MGSRYNNHDPRKGGKNCGLDIAYAYSRPHSTHTMTYRICGMGIIYLSNFSILLPSHASNSVIYASWRYNKVRKLLQSYKQSCIEIIIAKEKCRQPAAESEAKILKFTWRMPVLVYDGTAGKGLGK